MGWESFRIIVSNHCPEDGSRASFVLDELASDQPIAEIDESPAATPASGASPIAGFDPSPNTFTSPAFSLKTPPLTGLPGPAGREASAVVSSAV